MNSNPFPMIRVIDPGLFSLVQDAGRFGYRNIGVPVSGFMDSISASWANLLVGNEPEEALLEITMTGPTLAFQEACVFAVTGAYMNPSLNLRSLPNGRMIEAQPGDILRFGRLQEGMRAYIAFQGGLKVPVVLGSCSSYQPLTKYGPLKKGDVLQIQKISGIKGGEVKDPKFDLKQQRLEVYPGPEFDWLSKDQQKQLLKGVFTIAKENNRMAYQLQELLFPHTFSMLTSATLPGTVQLTPLGRMIILMRDAQTTGGYPRILQLSEKALCLLSQKHTGDTVLFDMKK